LSRPPSIQEFRPGIEYALTRPGTLIVALTLAALPWLIPRSSSSRRQFATQALFWTAGLALFAFAGRMILAWWVLCVPMIGSAAEHGARMLSALQHSGLRRVAQGAAALIIVLVAAPPFSPAFWLFEGNTTHRMLPRAGENPALW